MLAGNSIDGGAFLKMGRADLKACGIAKVSGAVLVPWLICGRVAGSVEEVWTAC